MLIDPTQVEPNVTTRDGAPVILFAYMSKQDRAYLGIFYCGDSWIACSWNRNGTYLDEAHPTGMDLTIVKNLMKDNKEAA